jgi:predicted ATPase
MLIQRLALKKILSFNDAVIEFGQLNVLIGPNAVGKSNLIEVIGLLQAAPTNLATAILRGGGVRQWLWLGDRVPSPASIECEMRLTRKHQVGPLGYHVQFSEDASGFVILGEKLARSTVPIPVEGPAAYFVRSFNQAEFRAQAPESGHEKGETMKLSPGESVLSQFKSPIDSTPITEVGNHFAQMRIFREFRTGPGSPARYGTSTSVPKDALMDGSDNLALVLHELDFLGVHERIKDYLRRFCERFEDVKVSVGEGLARTYLREAGLAEMLSAIRMSDGTLKFLSLLAALFHPKPPPLMCIEEPEIGLHPDAMQLVAEALVEASQSMQLIVTTHSDALIDSLTDRPDAVLVCERDFDNGTQMKHLSKEHLEAWLEHYTLGQLWRKGEIGGGRW